ncbi:NUDIX hydrolase [Diaporthe sp. PMI_573]|nr:NUDIX hydrolase [Diaporthaceae sp. PMI_573]
MSSDQEEQEGEKKLPEPKSPWERMVDCQTCKGRHFGLGGAAGMLLVRRDETKPNRPVTQVILQHRSYTTTAGGTWGLPGGALDEGENPAQGALREAAEEAGLPQDCADGLDPTIVILSEKAFLDHGAWKYTTVTAEVVKPFEPTIPKEDTESLEVKWVAIQDVETLPLHPSFGQAWPELKSVLEAMAGASTK